MGKEKGGARTAQFSSSDTYGIRGAGATWQADFGMPLDGDDLLFVSKRDGVGRRITFDFAHDVFDKWFEVEDLGENPDPKFNDAVQKVLDKLNAKAVFTNMAVFERIFGWAILAITYVDYGESVSAPVENPREIRELIAYSAQSFQVQSSDEDKDPNSPRFGLPIFYTVRRGSQGTQIKLHYTRAIHFATRIIDHPYIGSSSLEGVYDGLTVLRNMLWGFGQTIVRYGSGFPDVTVEGANKAALDKLQASQQFRSLMARTYFLHNDKTTFDFKGAAGRTLNPDPYYKAIMEYISCGCGIPEAILRGVQAGQLTGSEVNERTYFKLVSDAQSRYERGIRDLIDRLIETGQIRYKWNVNRGYKIRWLGAFEMNEKDKADVELRLAQARSWATDWKTVDELRAEEGLDPLPDATEGKTVLGLAGLRQKTQTGMSKQIDVLPSPSAPAGADSAEDNPWQGVVARIKRRL